MLIRLAAGLWHTKFMYSNEAKYIFDELKKAGIIGAVGAIKFELLNAEVVIKEKSAIGYLFQEWLATWFNERGIYNRLLDNSQEFPDFFLSQSVTESLLELKTFHYEATPAFDIANFNTYVNSLRSKAYRLDADYIIVGYTLREGVLAINDVWLKKIWELTKPSERFPLNCQVKYDEIVNIRPYNIKTNPKGIFQPFKTRGDFVIAIHDTLAVYRNPEYAHDWLREVRQSYKQHTGREI